MNDNFWIELARDLVFATVVVFLVICVAYLLTGTWPMMVGVESGSMMPHIYKGDIIFLQGISRTSITTYQVGRETPPFLLGVPIISGQTRPSEKDGAPALLAKPA